LPCCLHPVPGKKGLIKLLKRCRSNIHPLFIKRKYEGYDDEYWVRFWKPEWHKIIYGNDDSYIKKILDAGFDGAYLDNVEAYYFLYFRD